jgi:hypothetical protein
VERRRIGDIHVSGELAGDLLKDVSFLLALFGCDRNLADTYLAGEMEHPGCGSYRLSFCLFSS